MKNKSKAVSIFVGRAIFYNGQYRDIEFDINFMIDPSKDTTQKIEPINDTENPS